MNMALSMGVRRTVVLISHVTLLLAIGLGVAAISVMHTGGEGRWQAPALARALQMTHSSPREGESNAGAGPDFSRIVKKVIPSVVTVRSQRTVQTAPPPFGFMHPWGRPGENEDGRPQRRLQRGLGSGVVVDARGYILTNN